MITNVNEGVCQWRLTHNEPSFFVNWRENGEQHYRFFGLRSFAYDFFLRMKKQEQNISLPLGMGRDPSGN